MTGTVTMKRFLRLMVLGLAALSLSSVVVAGYGLASAEISGLGVHGMPLDPTTLRGVNTNQLEATFGPPICGPATPCESQGFLFN